MISEIDGPDWPTLLGEPLLRTPEATAPDLSLTEDQAQELADVLVGIGPPEPMTDAEVAEVLMDHWDPSEPSGRFTEEEAEALIEAHF